MQDDWCRHAALRKVAALTSAGLPDASAVQPDAGESTDWIDLVTLALAHNVGGLLHRAIVAGRAGAVPPPIADALRRHASVTAERNAAAFAEYLRLNAALAEASVPTIPLKGAWLCQRVYGDLGARPSRDIDFLIPRSSIATALEVLARCRYPVTAPLSPRQLRAKANYAGQFIVHRDDGGFAIEPHWALAPATLGLAINHDALWRGATLRQAGGVTLRTLAPEDEFLILCVHGFKEEWARLKWLADLAAFVAVHPQLDWEKVLSAATRQHLRQIVLVAVAMLAAVFALATPLTGAAGADCATAVAGTLLHRLVSATGSASRLPPESNIYQVSRLRLGMRERAVDRARYIAASLCTPREGHFQTLRLPDALFPAYYVLKPVHDYALLPLWIGMKRMPLPALLRRADPHPAPLP